MKRFTVAVVAISGCILGPACQAIVGIGDRVEAPPDDDGGADGSSSGNPPGNGGNDASDDGCASNTSCLVPDALPPVGCPTGCLPPAPPDWTGPSAVYDGAESTKPATCPAPYAKLEVQAQQGVKGAPAVCDCGPPTVTGRKCTASVVAYGDLCLNVGTKLGTAASDTGQCLLTSGGGNSSSYKVNSGILTAGSCTYPSAQTTKPELSYDKWDVACGLETVSACGSDPKCISAPIPDQPYGRMCIHREGTWDCPAADYSVKFVAHEDKDDTRACTTCTATPTGGGCGTKWTQRFKAQDCSGNSLAGTDMDSNTCLSGYSDGILVDIRKMAPTTAGDCVASGGAPTGTVSATKPVTFCCTN